MENRLLRLQGKGSTIVFFDLRMGVSNEAAGMQFAGEKGSTVQKRASKFSGNLPESGESECGFVNIDVVSPGSFITLALMYIRTNNRNVANRIQLAENVYDLNSIRSNKDLSECRSTHTSRRSEDLVVLNLKDLLHITII